MLRLAGLIFLFSFLSNESEPPNLTDCKWNIYKTVEALSNQQKSYTRIYKDTTYISHDQVDRLFNEKWPYSISQNRLGGPLDLDTDSTGQIKNAAILWHPIDDNTIFVEHDSSGSIKFNDYFLGIFEILELTDSTAILQKNLTTNGSWYRTFYLNKRVD
jgi:hypothetical protein